MASRRSVLKYRLIWEQLPLENPYRLTSLCRSEVEILQIIQSPPNIEMPVTRCIQRSWLAKVAALARGSWPTAEGFSNLPQRNRSHQGLSLSILENFS